jgi:Mg/Co/Ni transporter MgtE
VPLTVIVRGLALLSMNRLDWQVNRDVFVIAVNGVVLGVKVLEYKPVPFRILKFNRFVQKPKG